MEVGRITEEERVEIVAALQDRREALGKLADATEKRNIPTDYIEERLGLYTSRNGSPGLLALFGVQPDVEDEINRRSDRAAASGEQDLWGGGAETGGAPREKKDDPNVKEGVEVTPKERRVANPPPVGALIRWPGGKTTSIEAVIHQDGDGHWLVRDAEGAEVIVHKKRGKWVPEDADADSKPKAEGAVESGEPAQTDDTSWRPGTTPREVEGPTDPNDRPVEEPQIPRSETWKPPEDEASSGKEEPEPEAPAEA